MQKNIRLSEIDTKMEELCHQMYDAWNEGDIDTHITLLKQMQELAEEGKKIRKDNGEKDESIVEWVELQWSIRSICTTCSQNFSSL